MVKMLGGEHSIGMHIDGVKYELVYSLADSDKLKFHRDEVIYGLEDLVLKRGLSNPRLLVYRLTFTSTSSAAHPTSTLYTFNTSSKNGHYLT